MSSPSRRSAAPLLAARLAVLSPALLVFALGLTACGGGAAQGAPAPVAADPAFQASFGSPTPPVGVAQSDLVDIRVFNYSHAFILDMGLRPLGSTQPWIGSLHGHDPATYGRSPAGGTHWLTVSAGGYEIFVETDRGRIYLSGFTPSFTTPSGSTISGPADLYLFGLDFAGRLPR